MPSYILRHVDPDLWRRFRAACAYLNASARDVLILLVEDWTQKQEAKRGISKPR
jgi:hypothetical protein